MIHLCLDEACRSQRSSIDGVPFVDVAGAEDVTFQIEVQTEAEIESDSATGGEPSRSRDHSAQ